MQSKPLTVDHAATIALQALAFLVEDEEKLSRFMAITGFSAENLKAEASKQAFQAAIIEYLMSDESLLLVFCAHANVDPAEIAPAHFALAPESYGGS